MAEGLGSHNKTLFPYDHSGFSNCVFFPFFLSVLDFLWFSVPVFNVWHRFLVNFPQSVFFSVITLSEVSLDPQCFSSARTLSPCKATWISMNSHSSVDFGCIYLSWFVDWSLSALGCQKAGFSLVKHSTCSAFSQAKAGLWGAVFGLRPGWDLIYFNQRFYSQTKPTFC